jgi:hypothetical protein
LESLLDRERFHVRMRRRDRKCVVYFRMDQRQNNTSAGILIIQTRP